MCGVVKNKNPIPQNHFLLGQEKILPAVPPGLALLRPLYAYDNMQTLLTVRPAVLLTAAVWSARVLLALESPFGQGLRAALTPTAALCDEDSLTYLLFLIGLKLFYHGVPALSR